LRKKAGYNPDDLISVYFDGDEEIKKIFFDFADNIKSETKLKNIENAKTDLPAGGQGVDQFIELKIDNQNLWLGVKK
jgi:hypothetical protein